MPSPDATSSSDHQASPPPPHVTVPSSDPTTTGGPLKPKTISCTQCRRRKLKCDRAKPACGTCKRLAHDCVYPEGRKKSSMKRRNVKDLEARLAQVETLLNHEVAAKMGGTGGGGDARVGSVTGDGVVDGREMGAEEEYFDDFDLEMEMKMEMGFGNEAAAAGMGNPSPPMPMPSVEQMFGEQAFSNELIGFGMQEQLPSREIIDELHQIYFKRIYPSVPLLHKYRYLATVDLSPPLGPPMCLRYAVWAVAAATSDKFTCLQEIFYQRARKYLELDEMKFNGEHFITIAHAQTWALVSNYEAQNMYLPRAWLSTGRCVRLVQMMNLHRLDSDDGDSVRNIIPPPRDWMELEERRRTFWAAFCCDRYSCAGSGWPMAIDERDIATNLPASEEAFAEGRMETTLSLADTMTGEGVSKISPYAGVALMACLFGNNWSHLHRATPHDHPEDLINGEFWKRHRKMDNVLSNTFMFLPEQLRLPGGLRDPNVVYLNMNIHSSTICLHQAAAMKAERHNLDPKIIKQSYNRCRVAAEEIVNIMRLISHLDVAEMNSWTAFNLYVATGVLIEGCGNPETSLESRSNLDFLLTALQAIGMKHVVTKTFIAQLKVDLDNAGIETSLNGPDVPIIPIRGLTCGAPSIYFRNPDPGKIALTSEFFSQGLWSSHGSSSVAGGTESSSTSYKGAATPPLLDPNSLSTMQGGGLPRKNMNIRLRVSPDEQDMNNPLSVDGGVFGFQGNVRNEPGLAPNIPSSFRIPQMFSQYKISGDQLDTSDHGSAAEAVVTDTTDQLSFNTTNSSRVQVSGPGLAYRQNQHAPSGANMGGLRKEMGASLANGNINAGNGAWGEDWTFADRPMSEYFEGMEEDDMSMRFFGAGGLDGGV